METHADLLARAHRVRRAAELEDEERTRYEVAELIDAYLAHTDAERPLLRQLSRFRARLVDRGQERLLVDLVALSLEAEGTAGLCRCTEVGAELEIELALQIDAEQRAFAATGPAASDRS